ncbi:MAG: ATP phosphoribosyltransferase [Candidatus Peribacteraceae bacterium]|nr:ATP phosphoribosyltransferase [Candidatus Peribacteraceae bacterium]
MSSRLKIALQKKGRLAEESFELLRKIGLNCITNGQYLVLKCPDFPADVILLRDDDIPAFVARGSADLGIVGQNVIRESGKRVKEVMPLGFGVCRLAVAVPRNSKYKTLRSLKNSVIATEYPNSTKKFFREKKIPIKLAELSGSAEIAPEMGVADVIADIVDTGTTLEAHGLVALEPPIFRSEAVLVSNPKLSAEKKKLLDDLIARIEAVQAAGNKKYVMLNCREKDLKKIEKLMPALEAPTILPLAKKGEFALQSVATEKEFWDALPKLKKAGAKDILLLNVEKIVP